MMMTLLGVCLVAGLAQDLKQTLRELGQLAKQRDAAGVVSVIDDLTGQYPSLEAAQQKSVRKGFEALFKMHKNMDEDIDTMCVAASAAFSVMGDEGEECLLRSMKHKHLRERWLVLSTMLEALGQQANPARIAPILKHVDRGQAGLLKEAPLVAGAARALRFYREADGKARKKIVGQLIAAYVEYDKLFEKSRQADDDRADAIGVGFNAVESPILTTLSVLAGENIESAVEWQEWWNENKDANWDDLPTAERK